MSSKKICNKDLEQVAGSLIIEKLPGYFLIVCLLATLGFLVYLLSPFITAIFIAAVLTIAFYSVYRKILKFFRNRSRIASLVSCLLVVLIIIIPIALFVLLITSEALTTYQNIKVELDSGVFDNYLQWDSGGFFFDYFEKFKDQVSIVVDFDKLDIKSNIVKSAQTLSSFLGTQTINLVEKFSSLLLGVFIMLFSMYYFFKDGKSLVEKVGYISPLPVAYEMELFKKISSMVKAIIFGVFFTAILQGIVGGIGFAIVGIESAVFWGTAMAFLSLIPVVGTAIIWVPAVIILLIMGNYFSAVFLFLWGVIFVGSVDNIARTYLIGGKAKTYPLLTFFVILGGVFTMGLKGVIVGPLLLMILMSFLHIYECEYSKVLKKQNYPK